MGILGCCGKLSGNFGFKVGLDKVFSGNFGVTGDVGGLTIKGSGVIALGVEISRSEVGLTVILLLFLNGGISGLKVVTFDSPGFKVSGFLIGICDVTDGWGVVKADCDGCSGLPGFEVILCLDVV